MARFTVRRYFKQWNTEVTMGGNFPWGVIWRITLMNAFYPETDPTDKKDEKRRENYISGAFNELGKPESGRVVSFGDIIGWRAMNFFAWPYFILNGIKNFMVKGIDKLFAKKIEGSAESKTWKKVLKGIVSWVFPIPLLNLFEAASYGIAKISDKVGISYAIAKISEKTASFLGPMFRGLFGFFKNFFGLGAITQKSKQSDQPHRVHERTPLLKEKRDTPAAKVSEQKSHVASQQNTVHPISAASIAATAAQTTSTAAKPVPISSTAAEATQTTFVEKPTPISSAEKTTQTSSSASVANPSPVQSMEDSTRSRLPSQTVSSPQSPRPEAPTQTFITSEEETPEPEKSGPGWYLRLINYLQQKKETQPWTRFILYPVIVFGDAVGWKATTEHPAVAAAKSIVGGGSSVVATKKFGSASGAPHHAHDENYLMTSKSDAGHVFKSPSKPVKTVSHSKDDSEGEKEGEGPSHHHHHHR